MALYEYSDALDGISFQDVWSWNAGVLCDRQRQVEGIVQQEIETDCVKNNS